jgi:hypothetical protein
MEIVPNYPTITVFSLETVYLDQSFVLIQSLKWI